MKKNGIFKGFLILSIGSVLAKLFSAIYRIILTRILGGEGIGIYQLIFPFYSLCVTLATAGIPMAVSKVVAKNKGNEIIVLKKVLKLAVIVSIIIAFILILTSKFLEKLQQVKSISLCYLILSPSIIFVAISSVLRGYFQGVHNFTPTAISNIIEQFVKLFSGVVLSVSLLPFGLIYAVVGAVVAIVISEIISLFCLLVVIKKDKVKTCADNVSIKSILNDVLPITISNLILPFSVFIDSLLVVNLLSLNFTREVSVFLYGIETGAVSSLIGLPAIFSFAIASVVLPNISKEKVEFNQSKKLTLAIKSVLIISAPFALIFLLTPQNIINVLYSGKLNGFNINGGMIASRLLAWSSVGVVSLAVNQVLSSSLQALDERSETIKNLFIGVVVKLGLILIFMPSKTLNIYMLAIGNLFCYLTVAVLNFVKIKQKSLIKINWDFIVRLIFSNVIMLITLICLLMICDTNIMVILAYGISALVYLFCVYKTKTFSRNDMCFIKYGV